MNYFQTPSLHPSDQDSRRIATDTPNFQGKGRESEPTKRRREQQHCLMWRTRWLSVWHMASRGIHSHFISPGSSSRGPCSSADAKAQIPRTLTVRFLLSKGVNYVRKTSHKPKYEDLGRLRLPVHGYVACMRENTRHIVLYKLHQREREVYLSRVRQRPEGSHDTY